MTSLAFTLSNPATANEPVHGLMTCNQAHATYQNEGVVIAGEAGRGWTSWTVEGDAFLYTTSSTGGIVFRNTDSSISRFPNMSHLDRNGNFGRSASFDDGIYKIQITPDPHLSVVELYVGFNDANQHELVIYLNDAVKQVRLIGDGKASTNDVATHSNATTLQATSKQSAVLLHHSGRAIVIPGPCQVTHTPHPDGGERLAVVLPAKGLEANRYNIQVQRTPLDEYFVIKPQFNVTQPDDDLFSEKATQGVKNPVYRRRHEPRIALQFDWLSDKPFTGYATLQIIHALGETQFTQQVTPVRSEDGNWIAHFDASFTLAGVSDVQATLVGGDGRLIWTDRYRMLYDLEHYQPTYNCPNDLLAFWDQTLENQRSIPMDAKIQRVHPDVPDWELYVVSFSILDSKRVHAMLFVPKGIQTPAPVMVTSHPNNTGFKFKKNPNGLYGSHIKRDRRFISITPIVRGFEPDPPDVPFNMPWWGPLEDKQTYAARYWFATMVRAVDYLASRPDLVDMSRVVVFGSSQGGALATALAALDDRIALALIDSPSNAMHHTALGNYQTFGPSLGQIPQGQSMDDLRTTLSYFDPANLAAWIKCPTHVALSVGDLTVHSMGGIGIYKNLINVPADRKSLTIGPAPLHHKPPEAEALFETLLGNFSRGQ